VTDGQETQPAEAEATSRSAEAEATTQPAPAGPPGSRPVTDVKPRSELEIRWRQARNAPPPVVRAVLANVAVAFVGGIVLLLTDWLASRGVLPEAFLNIGPVVYVAVVIISGSLFTYLWVELPTGVPGEKRRSGWAGVLGFFASVPIVYLSLVIIFEVLRPLLP
jgi:hypothetical protein